MAARAAVEPELSYEALEGESPDLSSLHRIAERLAKMHARARPVDAAPFLSRLADGSRRDGPAHELQRQLPHLHRRGQAGRVRQLEDGRGEDILFDLTRDVAALMRRGLSVEATSLANRYLDICPQGAAGWAVMPLFLSLHAEAAGNPALADGLLAPSPPRLIAIGGLSGTGKSTLSRLVANRAGRAQGSRVIRSDVFRKRLAGLPPEGRLPPGHYTRRSDQDTYEAMFDSAYEHLACGSSVVLDAVFMSRSEREVAQELALRARVPFLGIWLEAPERDRIQRVQAREGDASDATAEVVREQSRRSVGPLASWHRIRTNRQLEMIVATARGALERLAS